MEQSFKATFIFEVEEIALHKALKLLQKKFFTNGDSTVLKGVSLCLAPKNSQHIEEFMECYNIA